MQRPIVARSSSLALWLFLVLAAASALEADQLPEFRPALLTRTCRSLVNQIDTEGLMKRGRGNAIVIASVGEIQSLLAATTPSGKILSPAETRATIVGMDTSKHSTRIQGTARRQTGVFLLSVRPNGTVERVEMLHSTGERFFDSEARKSLALWQFKPGSVKEVRVPQMFNRVQRF